MSNIKFIKMQDVRNIIILVMTCQTNILLLMLIILRSLVKTKQKKNGQRWITVESVYFNQKGLPLQIMVIQN